MSEPGPQLVFKYTTSIFEKLTSLKFQLVYGKHFFGIPKFYRVADF